LIVEAGSGTPGVQEITSIPEILFPAYVFFEAVYRVFRIEARGWDNNIFSCRNRVL
jgi:hypothetical protein